MYQWRVTIPATEGNYTLFLENEVPQAYLDAIEPANSKTAAHLALGWVSLLSDNPLGPLPSCMYRRFIRYLYSDYAGSIKILSELADELMRSEFTDDDGAIIRTYVKGLEKTPAYRVYLEWFRHGSPVLLRWLLSFLSFGKVAEFENSELEPKAFKAWLENETRLRSIKLSDVAVANVARVTEWLLDGFDWSTEELLPSHGPGVTAERGSKRWIEWKNANMAIDPELLEFFEDNFEGMSQLVVFVDPETLRAGYVWNAPRSATSIYPDYQGYYDLERRPATLTFVKKSYKAYRTICPLPIDKMFIGQGFRRQLYGFFPRGNLSYFVDLTSQVPNQKAARLGSLRRRIDTIDLQSASDSVLWELVRRSYPARLTTVLGKLRVPEVQYQGVSYFLEKHAPMGDPLCFPSQCIMFCAIAIASGLSQSLGQDMQGDPLPVELDIETLFHQTFASSETDPAGRYVYPRIFGDDICLDHRQTSNTIRQLEQLGFVVNKDKSFVGNSTFRESCGKFYSRGEDVSFIKYRKSVSNDEELSVARLAGFIDQANLSLLFGYKALRRFYVQTCLFMKVEGLPLNKHGKNDILFSNDDTVNLAIRFLENDGRPVNGHLLKMYNHDHQLWEYASVGLESATPLRHSGKYENYMYLQWQGKVWDDRGLRPRHFIPASDAVRWKEFFSEPQCEAFLRVDYRDMVPRLRWTPAW